MSPDTHDLLQRLAQVARNRAEAEAACIVRLAPRERFDAILSAVARIQAKVHLIDTAHPDIAANEAKLDEAMQRLMTEDSIFNAGAMALAHFVDDLIRVEEERLYDATHP